MREQSGEPKPRIPTSRSLSPNVVSIQQREPCLFVAMTLCRVCSFTVLPATDSLSYEIIRRTRIADAHRKEGHPQSSRADTRHCGMTGAQGYGSTPGGGS